ncbi:hypothetical protein BE17_08055 [Sorangium cellulosum]|uniref:Uncharacterized protein n=1 Tax=Sorangium cellulosum TaxID=56 RepID=A0A150RVS2_SORCE|nr:hypothetical protein BE17_08055 [Sorangium cellulosum]
MEASSEVKAFGHRPCAPGSLSRRDLARPELPPRSRRRRPASDGRGGAVTREELVRVPLSAIERADGAYLAEAPIDLATWMYMLMDHAAYLGGTEACSPFDREDFR